MTPKGKTNQTKKTEEINQNQDQVPAPAPATVSASPPVITSPQNPVLSPIPTHRLEDGYIKVTRKPAKMGTDYIIWLPRVYIKNGLLDPTCEYEIFMRKVKK